jgi:hypothetical protein
MTHKPGFVRLPPLQSGRVIKLLRRFCAAPTLALSTSRKRDSGSYLSTFKLSHL